MFYLLSFVSIQFSDLQVRVGVKVMIKACCLPIPFKMGPNGSLQFTYILEKGRTKLLVESLVRVYLKLKYCKICYR